jgi:phosphoglycerate dehydrogenase-like enzyme
LKIVLVGDLFITSQTCAQELDRIASKYGATYKMLDWEVRNLEELNLRNIHVEEKGPSAEASPDILWDLVHEADILIVHFCPVSKKLIDSSKNLEVIATMRTGLSNIDTAAAEELGIPVINLPGRLADSVSEYTIGLMIAETRNIACAHENIRKGKWTKYFSNVSLAYFINIAGAALDVFWHEPVDMTDPLLQLENVTVTSHLAGTTKDALSKSIYKLTDRLEPYYEKLKNCTGGTEI